MQANPDTHETRDLIACNKVVGADVYGIGHNSKAAGSTITTA